MSELARWVIAAGTVAVTVPLAALGVGLGLAAGLLRRVPPVDEVILARLQQIGEQIDAALAADCDCEDCDDLLGVADASGVTARPLTPAEKTEWASLRRRLGEDIPVDLWPEEQP